MAQRGGTMRGKKKKPCDDFEANEKAFGKCRKCNFSLAEHLGGGGGDSDEDFGALPPPPPEAAEEAGSKGGKSGKPCRNFTWKKSDGVDEWAGVCECGFAKSEHEREDRGVSMRLSKNLTHMGKKISKRFSKTKGKVVLATPNGVACDNFRLDLEGDQYGMCKCGFNRTDHLNADKKRQEYSTLKKAEAARIAAIERGDPTTACSNFHLDLTNKEGYGYCNCGFRRDQHVDFSSKAEFSDVTLSKPKDFV